MGEGIKGRVREGGTRGGGREGGRGGGGKPISPQFHAKLGVCPLWEGKGQTREREREKTKQGG
jgi:hypothetical protein